MPMKTNFQSVILILLYLMSQDFGLQAQTKPASDRVTMHLLKGVILRGDLIEHFPGISSTIVTKYGDTVLIPDRVLRRVEYLDIDNSRSTRKLRPYAFASKGLFHAYSIALNLNTVSSINGGLTGYELAMVFGFQQNRWLGYGIGMSADFYHPKANEMVFPVFGEVRGYFLDQAVSPYYSVRAGYGLVFENEEVDIISGKGGFMFNPSLGWRLGGRKGMNMTLDIGLKFQKAAFETLEWSERALTQLEYRRLHVRLGFLF